MASAVDRLTELQREISQENDDWDSDNPERLLFSEHGGLLYVEYYGPGMMMKYIVFEALCLPEVASRMRSLTFRGPDQGSNGTKFWNFDALLERRPSFPELKKLVIEPSPLEYHNYTVIGGPSFMDDGQLKEWLVRAPQLEHLTTPSAPNAQFFEVGPHPLAELRVEAGYDAQNFILHLSRASRESSFPYLRDLDFGEVRYHPREDWNATRTPHAPCG
jgi:hypothetical protein